MSCAETRRLDWLVMLHHVFVHGMSAVGQKRSCAAIGLMFTLGPTSQGVARNIEWVRAGLVIKLLDALKSEEPSDNDGDI